jgi:hypothetical protein
MTTAVPAPGIVGHAPHQPDIRIYSHSRLLYWWPVWAVGFLMALWSYFDGCHLAVVPAGTVVEGRQLVLPEGARVDAPLVHVARSPVPGAVFMATLLLVIVFSNASLRGTWALLFGMTVLALALLFAWLGLWEPLYHWAGMLTVYLNLGGYLTVAVPLFLVWVGTIFVLDRRTYVIFTAGQLRVCDRLGREERAFDAMSVAFEKRPFNGFHRLVGWGAGDLVLKAGGLKGETYELANVPRVARWLKVIEERLKTRDVE